MEIDDLESWRRKNLLSSREWWLALEVSPTERLRIRHDLATLEHRGGQIVDLEIELPV